MKLNKQEWKEVKYGQVVNHIEINERDPDKRAEAKYVSVEHLKTLNLKIQGIAPEEKHTFSRTFKKGQILFAKRRAYQKKVAVADFDGICSPHLWALETNGDLLQELLPFVMQKDSFYEYVNANSAGTMSTYLKWPALSSYKFLLPPKEEQQKILSVFSNLENQIVKTEEQSETYRNLRKKMINSLKRESKSFGKLDFEKSYSNVSVGEVSQEYSQRIDNPSKSPINEFIGLENFQSGELLIRDFGSTEMLVSAMKLCNKGDVLFARRNAYLKRTSMVEKDAVCSGDVIVIKPDTKHIRPLFLTLVLNTDTFWSYAISNAAGTMSKRVKWRDLKTYSFNLPNLNIQDKILDSFLVLEELIIKNDTQIENLKSLKMKLLTEIFD
ncbi:restriction endonuclease subunit S [Chitinophagales bacterium]|nr:restriction endonuclease subunit S [Chitinophagales bacterium]